MSMPTSIDVYAKKITTYRSGSERGGGGVSSRSPVVLLLRALKIFTVQAGAPFEPPQILGALEPHFLGAGGLEP